MSRNKKTIYIINCKYVSEYNKMSMNKKRETVNESYKNISKNTNLFVSLKKKINCQWLKV